MGQLAHLHPFVHVLFASLTHPDFSQIPHHTHTHTSPSTSMSSVKTGGWIRFDKFCSVWPRVRTGSTIQQKNTMFFTLLPPSFGGFFFFFFFYFFGGISWVKALYICVMGFIFAYLLSEKSLTELTFAEWLISVLS